MADGKPLNRDEALLAMNDHIGREVEVVVQAGVEMSMVMSAKGTLHHWRDHARGESLRWGSREDIAGLYEVGGASLDMTELQTAWLLADDGELSWGLSFFLSEGAALSVVWGVEPN